MQELAEQAVGLDTQTKGQLLEIVDLEAQFSLCQSGIGAMFSFEIFARHRIQENSKIFCIPIDARHVNSELVLAFPRNHYRNQAEQAFIACTQRFFATEANQRFHMPFPC